MAGEDGGASGRGDLVEEVGLPLPSREGAVLEVAEAQAVDRVMRPGVVVDARGDIAFGEVFRPRGAGDAEAFGGFGQGFLGEGVEGAGEALGGEAKGAVFGHPGVDLVFEPVGEAVLAQVGPELGVGAGVEGDFVAVFLQRAEFLHLPGLGVVQVADAEGGAGAEFVEDRPGGVPASGEEVVEGEADKACHTTTSSASCLPTSKTFL